MKRMLKFSDWRPKWFFNRVTQPQYRDRAGQLLPHPTPSHDPTMTNYDRHTLRQAQRIMAQRKKQEERRNAAITT